MIPRIFLLNYVKEFFAKLSNVMAKLKQFSVKLMVSENPVTYVLGRQMVDEKKALVITYYTYVLSSFSDLFLCLFRSHSSLSNFLARTEPLALRLEAKIPSFTVEPWSARSSFTAAEATAFCKAV